MRFAALDLQAYGHFTDRHLVLAPGRSDLHIVFGANEAGKSTARSAIGDFLFGIHPRTQLNFLHANPALRIGARIEVGAQQIEAVRRKGNKNTLLDVQGNAANELESELRRQLAGADRNFFTRMFSLDHASLRTGGEALAAAGANIDSALLSAGAGLSDVLSRRQALADEASALWAPSHSKNRRYYQAEERYKRADSAIREHGVTVGDWQRSRDALESADAHYQQLRAQRRDLDHQWRELERIRRVAGPLQQLQDIEQALEALGDTATLGDDARSLFNDAQSQIDAAQVAIAAIAAQIDGIDKELAELTDDPALHAQADAIERLAQQRARLADDRERIVDIDADNAQLAHTLAAHRAELGWPDNTVDWPSAGTIDTARTLAGRHATLDQQVIHTTSGLDTLKTQADRLALRAAHIGAERDTTALAAWQAACAREGDLEADERATLERVSRADRDIARRLAALAPAVADLAALQTLADSHLPSREQIARVERDMAAAQDTRKRQQQRVDDLADEAELARAAHARRSADDNLPSAEQLAAARSDRDSCWQLVRQQYIEQRSPDLFDPAHTLAKSVQDNPAASFEQLNHTADELADARFERSHAIAEQAERARRLAQSEQAVTQARQRSEQAEAEVQQLHKDWVDAWAGAQSITPATPAVMQTWLERLETIRAAVAERDEAAAAQASLSARIDAHRQAGIQHLVALDVAASDLTDTPLAELIERARQLVDTEQRQRQDRAQLTVDQTDLDTRTAALQSEHQQAQADLTHWQRRWADALVSLGLTEPVDVDDGVAALNTLDAGRLLDARLQEQSAERARLAARCERFFDGLAEVLAGTGRSAEDDARPEQTVQHLHEALRMAQAQQQTRETRAADRRQAAQRIDAYEDSRHEAQGLIEALRAQAGADDMPALDAAIERADQQRRLHTEQAKARVAVAEQGDGQPVAELAAAVEASDLDSLRNQASQLAEQLEDLDPTLGIARDNRNAARALFEAIGGDDRAVIAATERQTALSDMTDAAEQYLRVGTAALLLKWAGQRYAIDKQRPMIERGSTLINQLTGGSIRRLAGEFDDAGELQIVGVRADDARVAPTGMSEGTRDQLYLALRVAAIEDYLDHGAALPVVADDLFINFDDERAMAGLDVLAGLAERTQVLFFTHHQHLRDMAVERLGQRVTAHDL